MRPTLFITALLCCLIGWSADAAFRDKVQPPVALTDGSTIAVDASLGTQFTLTLAAASHTISNPTNVRAGQYLDFFITQGGSGGFRPLWDTNYTFPNGPPIYNTAAAGITVVTCGATATSVIQCLGTTINKPPVALTDSSTIAVDASLGTVFTLTLAAGSHTISNPTNLRAGQYLDFFITQGGSGGFTPLWDTQYAFPNGTPIYNTAAAAVSVVTCAVISTSLIDCLGTVTPLPANPTATMGTAVVNGSLTTYMRSDAAPAMPLCSSTVFGACKVDNSSITAASGVISATAAHVPTQQRFTSGSALTYTTPANTRQLQVMACAGGGGGGGTGSTAGTNATAGGTTTFNAINAVGGGFTANVTSTTAGVGGSGGSGGTGTATWRVSGQAGLTGVGAQIAIGPTGGLAYMGGPLAQGGQGASSLSTARATGGAGGGGECFFLIINSPAGSYTYTVGGAGSAGTGGGTNAANGAAGGAGFIIVDELC